MDAERSGTDAARPSPRPGRPPRRALLAGALIVLAIAGGGVWMLSLRKPAGPAGGTRLAPPGAPPPGRAAPASSQGAGAGAFRVAFYNIHRGRGTDGKLDLGRTLRTIRRAGPPDVVGLAEVDASNPFDANQAEHLGRGVQRRWLFAPTETRWGVAHFGNAVLSAHPARTWRRVPLPSAGSNTFRNLLVTDLAIGERRLRVLTTHVDLKADRRMQLAEVFAELASAPGPAVLLGDLNSSPDDPQVKTAIEQLGLVDALRPEGPETPGVDPHVRARDWILVRGLEVRARGAVVSDASDHALLWADLAFEPQPAASAAEPRQPNQDDRPVWEAGAGGRNPLSRLDQGP